MDIKDRKVNKNKPDDIIKGMAKEVMPCYNLAGISPMATGGNCLAMMVIDNEQELKGSIVRIIKNGLRFKIIGGATNLLFSDDHMDLVIIRLGAGFDYIRYTPGGLIDCGTSTGLQSLVVDLAKNNYDLSFLGGIPGTVGGAVVNNSGTHATGICSYIRKLKGFIQNGKSLTEKTIKMDKGLYRYRKTVLPDNFIMTGVVLAPPEGKKEIILNNIRNMVKRKKSSQPVTKKNLGCVFKNPESTSMSSGEMIDRCGLKGFTYGGAMVSDRHANFIINFKGASSEDIRILSCIIKEKVKEKFGIDLEYEIEMVGFNNG